MRDVAHVSMEFTSRTINVYCLGGGVKAAGLVCSVPVRAYQETPYGVTANGLDHVTRVHVQV